MEKQSIMKTHRNILVIFILSVWGVIIYSNTFDNSFHLDDFSFILNNPVITKIANLKAIFNYWPARFIGSISFAGNYKIHGFQVFGYHLVNLAGHILTSIVVFWFVNLTFSTPAVKTNPICRYKKPISFFIAAFFLAHPVQTETVNYIFQRVTILAAFFYLSSLCLYIKAMPLKSGENRINKLYYFLSLMAAFMGTFAKENSATLPLAILLYDSFFLKTEKRLKIKLLLPFFVLPLLMIFTLYTARPIVFSDVQRLFGKPSVNATPYLLTQVRVILTYLRLFVFPIRQNFDYDYPVIRHIWDVPELTSLTILIFIVILGIRMFSKYRLISFGIFWFFLVLLPESSIIPLLDPIYEHRLYLPLVGCSIFTVVGVYYLLKNNQLKAAVIILSLALSLCSLLTYSRNRVWKSEVSLWSDVIKKSPGKMRPYNERGLAYFEKGEAAKAVVDFTSALQINPDYVDGFYNRGNVYENQGKYEKAACDYTQAIRINPLCLKAYLNRGRAYYLNKEYTKAVFDFKRIIEIDHFDARGYAGLGSSYCAIGNNKDAITSLLKAIELNPNIAVACYNLAVQYYYTQQYDLAIKYCDKANQLGYEVGTGFLKLLKPYRKRAP